MPPTNDGLLSTQDQGEANTLANMKSELQTFYILTHIYLSVWCNARDHTEFE